MEERRRVVPDLNGDERYPDGEEADLVHGTTAQRQSRGR
jgi:hypothetical protein